MSNLAKDFFSIALLVLFGWATTSTNVDAAPAPTDDVTELIVLYDQKAPTHTTRAEDIVAGLNSVKSASKKSVELKSRFGNAKSARLAITNRLDRARRSKLDENSPEERLQRFIVLRYSDRQSTLAALDVLRKNPHTLSVEENGHITLSAVPNDPFYDSSAALNFQWGMKYLGASKGLETAWDTVHGTASVAVLDTGIYLAHPDLQGQVREHFSTNWIDPTLSVEETRGRYCDTTPPTQIPGPPTGVGHGTHVAGVIAGKSNNGIGVTGVCWNCNLWIQKVVNRDCTQDTSSTYRVLADGIIGAVQRGAQVINMSLGSNVNRVTCESAPTLPPGILCTALAAAEKNDVVMVAASGNENTPSFQFPASDSRVIAVGAIRRDLSRWVPLGSNSSGSNYASNILSERERLFAAPGDTIISTFYPEGYWTEGCYDKLDGFSTTPDGYSPCTGTSMASPHIAGLVALLRSAFPLLTKAELLDVLQKNSWQPDTNLLTANSATQFYGRGVPHIQNALTAAEQKVGNRLTPLFAFYGAGAKNYFYSVFPQQGRAALAGDLLPASAFGNSYAPQGNAVSGYATFPGDAGLQTARAQVWVFSTQKSPYVQAELAPLYRLSFKNSSHVDHTYTTNVTEKSNFQSAGYAYDGIEGYLIPADAVTKPGHAVAVYRVFSSAREDYAVVPESKLTDMAADGYPSASKVLLGYAFENGAAGIRPGYVLSSVNDLSGDRKSDLIVQSSAGTTTAWLMNGTAITSNTNILANDPSRSVTHVGDFNGDGKADLLWRNTNGSVNLWLMNGASNTSNSVILGPDPNWSVSYVADFNGDGKADILWRNTNGAVTIWLMNGTTVTSAVGILGADANWRVSHVGDFNGDGKADILWRNTSGAVTLWLMDGTTTSSAVGLLGPDPNWIVSHVADFNGDGKADLLWRNTNGAVTVWLMNGSTIASTAGIIGADANWSVTHVGDFNGDGKADLLWRNLNGAVKIWTMNGTTSSYLGEVLGPDPDWRVSHIADLNGDGKSDLIWRKTDNSITAWLMDGATGVVKTGLSGAGTLRVVPLGQ
jgi:subtilisin family serine protease